jgi:hypothetical protein
MRFSVNAVPHEHVGLADLAAVNEVSPVIFNGSSVRAGRSR